MKFKIINFVFIQIGWWSCVLGGDLWAASAAVVLMVLHFSIVCKNRVAEAKFLVIATLIGSVADTILLHLGFLKFQSQSMVIPIWLICLWLSFSTSINNCLSWIKKKPWIGSISGVILAPFAYYSGTRFDALKFGDQPAYSLIAVGISYGLIVPLFAVIGRKIYLKKDEKGDESS